jgi:DNA modification methylase
MILAGCPAGGTVLDPFAGSGTTILVANQLGRNGIGLDLNFQYLRENAKERLRSVQPTLI